MYYVYLVINLFIIYGYGYDFLFIIIILKNSLFLVLLTCNTDLII